MQLRYWLWLVIVAAIIAFGRLWAIGHYQWTGEKVISESLLRVGFWLQFILFGLGVAMRKSDQRSRRATKEYSR